MVDLRSSRPLQRHRSAFFQLYGITSLCESNVHFGAQCGVSLAVVCVAFRSVHWRAVMSQSVTHYSERH